MTTSTQPKTGHTELPWKANEDWIGTDRDNQTIAYCSDHRNKRLGSHSERCANAQFIALACNAHFELLAACERAIHDIDHPEAIHPRSKHTLSMATQQLIREAISKARGL